MPILGHIAAVFLAVISPKASRQPTAPPPPPPRYPCGVLFGKKKEQATEPAAVVDPASHPGKKGRPTPTRKEAEAAKKRPLVPHDRKEAAKTAKSERRRLRDLEYQALQGGDARYLPYKDKGPVRAYIRDWVDSRRTVSEYFILIALVGMFGMVIANSFPRVVILVTLLLYSMFAAMIIENIWLTRKLKKILIAKFGDDAVVRGTLMYMVSRNTQIRRMRLPKPRFRPGGLPAKVKKR